MRIRGVTFYNFIALHLSLYEGADFLNFTFFSCLNVWSWDKLGVGK